MSFRTDKLVLLLDTGTSTQVRKTAAKQLADLTLKTFRAPPPDQTKDDLHIPGADIKPDISSEGAGAESKESGPYTIEGRVGEDDSWTEVLDTIARILSLLKSRSSETRSAAANALGLLGSTLPPYTTATSSSTASASACAASDMAPIDVRALLSSGQTLLASAGREYVTKPMTSADKAKRRKAMMGSLGLGEVGWGDDVDQVIGDDEDDTAAAGPSTSTPTPKQEEPAPAPQDIFEGLSARQITMLKRKKGDMVAEANKMRKLNAQVNGSTSTPAPESASASATATPAPSPGAGGNEAVTIDPGAKARAAAAAAGGGGAVEPELDAAGNPIAPSSSRSALTMRPGISPWTVVLLEIVPDLDDQAWQTRHGTASALLELLRSASVSLSTPAPLLLSIARQLLSLLVLDRFGDFVGDTVIAPVRETAAQALGVLLKYLPDTAVLEVHAALLEMVKQPWAKRGKQVDEADKFRWEVRHAGLLGIKYEVAVRGDLLLSQKVEPAHGGVKVEAKEEIKPDLELGQGRGLLHDVVDAALLALRDVDDDVRTVAASALTPITDTLSSALAHDELASVVDTLWDCLAEGGDDLGSSTGAVMDLLGAMIAHSNVMTLMGETDPSGQPRQAKITRIFAFIRHPIATVRLAVARVMHTFTTTLTSPSWQTSTYYSLLFQNLVLEERPDIRAVSYDAFTSSLSSFDTDADTETIGDSLDDWYQMVMTPPGAKIEPSLLTRPPKAGSSSHNVDKAMMEGDLSLLGVETVMETRLLGARALADLRRLGSFQDVKLLKAYLASPSAHQVYMASTIITQWAQAVDLSHADAQSQALGSTDPVAQDLSATLLTTFERPSPASYSEMSTLLKKIHAECHALLSAFATEGKVAKDRIPTLPTRVDPTSSSSSATSFTLATAQTTITSHFDALAAHLSKYAIKHILPQLRDRRTKVMVSVGRYGVMKDRYDVQVTAGLASALVALRVLPPKIGPVVKAIMDGVKKEENPVLQARSADSIARLIHLCGSPLHAGRPNPSDKVVKNLFTFLCQDTSINPVFTPATATEGIISLKQDQASASAAAAKPKGKKTEEVEEETEEQIAMRVMRRGALLAFERLATTFGEGLLDKVPKYWEGIAQALINNYADRKLGSTDERFSADTTAGQDVIDALTSLRLTVPHLDHSLRPRILVLFPHIIAALQSSYALIRVSAAKCLAALCDVMTEDAMKMVVDHVVPLIGDAKRVHARQGSVEAVHHIIRVLEIKALPYVLFLIVPILGRMSDPDEPVRLLSTSTFASLVKMVPLEAGIPDPPGFAPDLLAKRDDERQFLMQLLDGSKAEQYAIPIEIKADLRQYQRDGVSWLAFLAKYQLHGILCDDMGLGKSLQSICIIGSKHHERAVRHRQTGSVDSAHLPSLIVCPPTLCGHWYHEILKFTDYLHPVQYTGSSAHRATLRAQGLLSSASTDVVITSYETVRADIDVLAKIDWLYCVLDEGHIIKNAKTKLSAAVKQLRAQHRLLLSGTPIQNNVLELWSLFDFLMPGFLGTERVFNDRFSKPILADREGKASPKERELATAALESLHKQVLPFLLRRLKEDVLHDLPPKIIQDYHCELSDIQKKLYDEYSRSQAAAEAGEEVADDTPGSGSVSGGKQQHVFQSLQYLRKLCNHPALVLQNDPVRTQQLLASTGTASKAGIHDIAHSPKLEALKQLLNDCGIGISPGEPGGKMDDMSGGQHRVLIFCQLRPMLDLIERDLFAALMPSVSYMRMDGSTDPSRRHAVVQTFNADPRIDVLLLTTSVGGLGLNLTGADTVIFVDHDWNPMKDLQAMDRAHRLGQRKVVNVYRLITRGTLEEKIMGLQRFKLNIASSVVTQQNSGLGSMNTGEVLDLFKVSAEGEGGPGQQKTKKDAGGPVSASKVLEGLDDLPPEDEYAELSLSNFMAKV